MANVIKPKRSNTAAKVPTTSDLLSGEFGVNMADQKSYINNGTSVVQVGAGKLIGLQDVTITSPTSGQTLTWDGTAWVNATGAGSGTVTSVGITPSTGVTVSNSPITSSGNITVGLSTKLTAIENLSGAGFFTQNGSGVIAGRTIQAGTGISVAHGNGSSQDPTISNSGVLGVTGTSPVASSGGQNPVISMTQASGSVNGWLSSTDWNTFNNKTSNTGTVTSVSGTGGYGGLTLSGTVTSSGNITLGGTPTGTWPISVSGNSATTSGCTFTNDAVNKANITTRTDSGFYEHDTATTAEGWPVNSGSWQHMIACTHTNDSNYYSMQIAGSFFDNVFYGRKTNGVGTTGWVKFCTDLPTQMIYDNFTATGGQTTFTASQTYTASKIQVLVNGVMMINGADVTVSGGTSVVMAFALTAGDRVTLIYPI
jgi:hypothetical protein